MFQGLPELLIDSEREALQLFSDQRIASEYLLRRLRILLFELSRYSLFFSVEHHA